MFTSVLGTLETSTNVFVRGVARGAYLTRTDVDTQRRVAVLGSGTARALFGDRDPIGAQLSISGVRFRVVGLFAPIGQSLGVDRDDEVHIPITTAHRLFGTTRVDAMAVKAPDREQLDVLSQRIVAELKTTFASHYTAEISLIEALQPEVIRAYNRRATGEKYLINPHKGS